MEAAKMQGKYPVLLLSFEMKGDTQTNTTQSQQTKVVVQPQKFHFFILQAGDGGAQSPPPPEVGGSRDPFPPLIGFLQRPAVRRFWVGGWQVSE